MKKVLIAIGLIGSSILGFTQYLQDSSHSFNYSSGWNQTWRHLYTYNENNERDTYKFFDKDVYNEWQLNYRQKDSYLLNGKFHSHIKEEPESNGLSYIFTYKSLYHYDTLGVDEVIESMNWNGTDWRVNSRDEIIYASNGEDSINTYYQLMDSLFKAVFKNVYTYYSNGNLESQSSVSLSIDEEWLVTSYEECVYNVDGIEAKIVFDYDNETSSIDTSWKLIYSYEDGTLVSQTSLVWEAPGSYSNYFLTSYINNDQHMPTERIGQNWSGFSWNNYSRSLYFYSDKSEGIKEFSNKKNVKVYPNPTVRSLFIDAIDLNNARYVVFNKVGEQVKWGQLDAQELKVDDLINGMYFVSFPGKRIETIAFEKF